MKFRKVKGEFFNFNFFFNVFVLYIGRLYFENALNFKKEKKLLNRYIK